MRWLFLLLLVLNVFYYVWHQQEAPLRAKEVTSLSLYRGSQQDIRLLSESADSVARRDKGKSVDLEGSCLYVGGLVRREPAQLLGQRLASLGVESRLQSVSLPDSPGYWLRIAPGSQHLLGDLQLQNLAKEFNELKHKIMPCEGIATGE